MDIHCGDKEQKCFGLFWIYLPRRITTRKEITANAPTRTPEYENQSTRRSSTYKQQTAWKVSVFGVFLVRILLHLDWIRGDTEYRSVFSPNCGKIRTRKTPNTDTFHAVTTLKVDLLVFLGKQVFLLSCPYLEIYWEVEAGFFIQPLESVSWNSRCSKSSSMLNILGDQQETANSCGQEWTEQTHWHFTTNYL